MLKSKEKETSKDTGKKESRERQLSNHLIVSQTEYICIVNDNVLYPNCSVSILTVLCNLQVICLEVGFFVKNEANLLRVCKKSEI